MPSYGSLYDGGGSQHRSVSICLSDPLLVISLVSHYIHLRFAEAANRIVDAPGYDVHGQVGRCILFSSRMLLGNFDKPRECVLMFFCLTLFGQNTETAMTRKQIPEKIPKNETFNCDHCGQKVGAAKFAAHLAKCMGHGGRQQRLRGNADAQSSQAPLVSTSPSNTRPVPSPPPAVSSGLSPGLPMQIYAGGNGGSSSHANSYAGGSGGSSNVNSPLKRAPSPAKVSDPMDPKRPRAPYYDGQEVV